jgi:acyl-homoserine-lactone acylase
MRTINSLVALGLAVLVTGCSTTETKSSSNRSESVAESAAIPLPSKDYDVKILRDTWGVPHIFGKTDPDVGFGLAYAHCEDDFKNIQDTMIATRSLGGSVNGADAAAIDFIVHILGVWDDVNAKYETDLSDDTRALCEAYADGINLFAEKHPEMLLIPEIFPVTGKDIVAGFVFKSPFFFGLDGDVLRLFRDKRIVETSTKSAAATPEDAVDLSYETAFAKTRDFLTQQMPYGSNTFSVSPKRSADGSTFLNVNSHQPYEGPVAWYEAHLHSEDGWDMVGGLFPGMPVIGHGHNRDLGWAMTVNSPDLVDIYVLEINPDNPDQYKYDGEWRGLEIKNVTLKVKIDETSGMKFNIRREVIRSVYGPVLRQEHGVYAIRYAGMGEITQVEQWYRMNKATNRDEFMEAMKIQGISSLNVGYGDKEGNIMYIYNAKLPKRTPGYDWELYLPGNTSDTYWDEYLPFEKLPMVINPESGFTQNCNATPFLASFGDDNPKESDFDPNFGIETNQSNRSLRAIEQFRADESITKEEFYRYKYDMMYSKESVMAKFVGAIKALPKQSDPLVEEAIGSIRKWDLSTHPDSRGAAISVMSIFPLARGGDTIPTNDVLLKSVSDNAQLLKSVHGQLDVPWSQVNRIIHGDTNLGVGGGPDILHAVYGVMNKETGQYKGSAGDCYVMIVDWDADGSVSSESIHQYGSATIDETSPHYADQSPLFVARKLKPVWYDESDIRAHLEKEYAPGQE